MEVQVTEALNTLPVSTYRWLKLNALHLDRPIKRRISPYHKPYIQRMGDERVTIAPVTQVNVQDYLPPIPGFAIDAGYGVSGELVRIGETHYNSGVLVHVPQGHWAATPVEIAYGIDSDNDILVDHNLIVAERGSQVTVIIDYHSDPVTRGFHSGTMRVYAEAGAQVTVVKVQRLNDVSQHFDSTLAYVERDAKVSFVQVELGGQNAVTSYTNNLGEAGEAELNVLYLGDKERRLDLSYLLNHIGPRSLSDLAVRGALKDTAKKVFRGTIDFHPGARRARGSEEESVLLLDKGVKSDAVPLLLCREDDVQGNHAASAGQVDETQLFYLMSRGFSYSEALKLLVEASFRPVLERIPNTRLREAIDAEIHRRLVNAAL